jgi:membrane-bound lytic murein transglycosylase A
MPMNSASPSTISNASHSIARCPLVRAGRIALAALACALAACASVPEAPPPAVQAALSCPDPVAEKPPEKPVPPPITWANSLIPVDWDALPGWTQDRVAEAWGAFQRSCSLLSAQPAWRAACEASAAVDAADDTAVRAFFEGAFAPHAVVNPDGTREGTITGYYEPVLRGSRTPDPVHRFPAYAVPDDLLVVDLSELYPELKPMRLRGRIDGRRVVPYYSRGDLESGKAALAGREILWTDDAVELFFLQIQGSGQVILDSGETVRLSYAEQNGHPYRSIGRLLVERGELTLDQASMQGIKAWGARNPERLSELLNQNASFVFFRELPATDGGPPGALGVGLTAGRSLAVDPRAIPLGAPVFIATTWPNSEVPLQRLMMAQDTGGAIKGAARADFYWGSGNEAGVQAGRMRQMGQLYVLLPQGFPLNGVP